MREVVALKRDLTMKKKVCLIFDFWLTLWDPEPDNEDFETLSRETLLAKQHLSKEQIALLSKELGGAFFVGVATLLRIMKPHAVFVVATQSELSFVKRSLKAWGLLEYFDVFLTTHRNSQHNENAQPLTKQQLIKNYLQDTKGKELEPIFIADSASDARVCQQLGFPFIHKRQKEITKKQYEAGWMEERLDEGADLPFCKRFPSTLLSSADYFKIIRFILWRYLDVEELDFTGKSHISLGVEPAIIHLEAPKKLSKTRTLSQVIDPKKSEFNK